MAIYVWGYLKEFAEEKEEILEAVTGVLESGKLVLGPNVSAFEEEFAQYCGVSFGIGVDNGTNSITLALRALGVKPGDEVITVSNTAVPTVSAIVSAGATPVFVDIDQETYLMDVALIENAITEKTTCIVPVHLYGQCVDMGKLNDIAGKHGLKVLEDCAQAHGATQNGKVAGSMSDASSFSFYPTKILGAYGDGGMILTSSQSVQEKLKRLRFYGMESTYYAVEHGFNSRLDEMHAAILRKKLVHLDTYIQKRRDIAQMYDELLADTELILPVTADDNFHAYYLYVVRHPKRDEIMEKLKKREIFLNISYPWPIHTMTGYAHLGWEEGSLPNTEAAAKEIFSLPMFPTLEKADVEEVCVALKEIMNDL
ncbi:DegT/DnrJ/EryC1/StrS family aminotransferase [Pseudodesulfovibrio sp. zrk46]|uniref:DegT/DnrJ/EryC1/StrS family aminotransferase n=1 Tax=Pseudodesulfovibrio sp. zrk46 TaxID=2725288 RepID=UPI00144A2CF5|nr:DegT/DnrJ/EryC1/StrS family aminotransferase [Pseudodesulfovibrio sp. zrk46]QJB58044.1 DegT/DnrJ/EryC1/StrS family aminotransferase [Pseudodesulfovibrio sp. zrk46]